MAARLRAWMRPSPWAAPVTIATLPSSSPMPLLPRRSETFDDRAGADRGAAAHGDEGGRGVAPLELVQRRHDQALARRPRRVAEGDGAAVDVDLVLSGSKTLAHESTTAAMSPSVMPVLRRISRVVRVSSRCRPPELQIMLVASPRNHHNLQREVARFWRPLRILGGAQHRRQIPFQLDLQFAAPETSWPAHFRAEFERLAARLAAHRIAVKPWLLSWEYPKVIPEL